MKTIAAALILTLAFVPAASAQDLTGPAERHIAEKTQEAQASPTGFAKNHTSEEAVAREAEWGVAYGCYVVAESHDQFGTPDPELEQCDDYEEALGIEEENQTEEPVGDAKNLTEEPVGEAKELAGDALDSVDRILDDPQSAPDEALSLAMRIGGFALWLVAYLLGAIDAAAQAALGAADDLVGGLLFATETLGAATTTAGAVPVGVFHLVTAALGTVGQAASDLGHWVGEAIGALGMGLAAAAAGLGGAVGDAGAAVGHGFGSAADAVGEGIADAGKAIGDGVGSIGSGIADAAGAVGDFVGGLFGGSEAPAPVKGPVGEAGDQAGEATGGLVEDLLALLS